MSSKPTTSPKNWLDEFESSMTFKAEVIKSGRWQYSIKFYSGTDRMPWSTGYKYRYGHERALRCAKKWVAKSKKEHALKLERKKQKDIIT